MLRRKTAIVASTARRNLAGIQSAPPLLSLAKAVALGTVRKGSANNGDAKKAHEKEGEGIV